MKRLTVIDNDSPTYGKTALVADYKCPARIVFMLTSRHHKAKGKRKNNCSLHAVKLLKVLFEKAVEFG